MSIRNAATFPSGAPNVTRPESRTTSAKSGVLSLFVSSRMSISLLAAVERVPEKFTPNTMSGSVRSANDWTPTDTTSASRAASPARSLSCQANRFMYPSCRPLLETFAVQESPPGRRAPVLRSSPISTLDSPRGTSNHGMRNGPYPTDGCVRVGRSSSSGCATMNPCAESSAPSPMSANDTPGSATSEARDIESLTVTSRRWPGATVTVAGETDTLTPRSTPFNSVVRT